MNTDAGRHSRPQPSTADQSTAYIYRLPNEVLHLTFTFLFHLDESVAFPHRTNDPVWINPVLIVRWVYAWFRRIASQHPIWLDTRYSDLSALSPCRYNDGEREIVGYTGRFIQVLLDDDLLREYLEQKSRWKFSAPNDFGVVVEKAPSLVSHIWSVELERMDRDIRWMLRTLASFTSLTRLSIRSGESEDLFSDVMDLIDLDTIAYSCPQLEDITLGSMGYFCGSFANLQHIKTLCIEEAPAITHSDEKCNLIPLLPFNSARSFSSLTFLCRLYSNLQYNSTTTNPFGPFTQLTTIKMLSINPETLDFIADAEFQLLDLTLIACPERPEAALRMLYATSFRILKRLRFEVPDLKFQQTHFSALGKLEYLEWLSLDIFMPKVWWFELAGFKRLKRLAAYIVRSEFEQREDGFVDLDEFILTIKKSGGFTEVDIKDCSGWFRRGIFITFCTEGVESM